MKPPSLSGILSRIPTLFAIALCGVFLSAWFAARRYGVAMLPDAVGAMAYPLLLAPFLNLWNDIRRLRSRKAAENAPPAASADASDADGTTVVPRRFFLPRLVSLLPTLTFFLALPAFVSGGWVLFRTPVGEGSFLVLLLVSGVTAILNMVNDSELARKPAPEGTGRRTATRRRTWAIRGAWGVLLSGLAAVLVAGSGSLRRPVAKDHLPLDLATAARKFRWAKSLSERRILALDLVSTDRAFHEYHPGDFFSAEAWMSRLGAPDATNRIETGARYAYRIGEERVLVLQPQPEGIGTMLSVEPSDGFPAAAGP